MNATISITSRWQIHIPKSMRKFLGVERPGKVIVTAKPGKIVIKPTKSTIMQYAGKLHAKYKKKKIDIDNIRGIIDYSSL